MQVVLPSHIVTAEQLQGSSYGRSALMLMTIMHMQAVESNNTDIFKSFKFVMPHVGNKAAGSADDSICTQTQSKFQKRSHAPKLENKCKFCDSDAELLATNSTDSNTCHLAQTIIGFLPKDVQTNKVELWRSIASC
jgi:hypothetical protein